MLIEPTEATVIPSQWNWISVKQQLPPIGKAIIAMAKMYHCNNSFVTMATLYSDGESIGWMMVTYFNNNDKDVQIGIVTHWMELPEPIK